MDWIQALILGLLQGLTEFLPVSSSGHIELGKAILNTDIEKSLSFTIVVHGATVLSTIIVFRRDLKDLIGDFFKFKWNESTQYIFKIFLSMIPVIIVGLFAREEIEQLFTADVRFVGFMLLITSTLLFFTIWAKTKTKDITFKNSILIGISQALAIIPGISRSGATITTGLFLGIDRKKIAGFSFLMVLIPIIGQNLLYIIKGDIVTGDIKASSLLIGFVAAFLSGLLACKWMLRIVQKGKLIYFAGYCLIIGIIAIVSDLI